MVLGLFNQLPWFCPCLPSCHGAVVIYPAAVVPWLSTQLPWFYGNLVSRQGAVVIYPAAEMLWLSSYSSYHGTVSVQPAVILLHFVYLSVVTHVFEVAKLYKTPLSLQSRGLLLDSFLLG